MPTTGRARPGSLPLELSSFVGRGPEVDEVKRRLAAARLVTLTGVGGAGKTRLALRVAAEVQRAFRDGVWLVDVTRLHGSDMVVLDARDSEVLADLVMAVLGVQLRGGGSSTQQLIEHLAGRQTLLVLDNCEQLIPASAMLIGALLRGCPQLRVLTTSREPLTITGEMLYQVPPLRFPGPGGSPSVAELSRYEAVALFVARAQAAVPAFTLTDGNAAAVGRLCRRLDGLPLAIELAAARIRVLTPQQVLDRLSDRFALLAQGSCNGPARQQTLRACVEWSFDLCSKPERLLWGRLSVFAGGFELDAVEGVCADESLSRAELLDVLTGLVEKSIVGSSYDHRVVRYTMLETTREYGQERLVEAADQAGVRRRHRDWHQRLAAVAGEEWLTDRQAYWYARLPKERANLRAAVEYSLAEAGAAAAALRIVLDLPRLYWSSLGDVREGMSWLARAFALATAQDELRARALAFAGAQAIWSGDTAAMARWLDEGRHLARQLDDPVALALVAYAEAQAALQSHDLGGAIDAAERGLHELSSRPKEEVALRLHLLLHLGSTAGFTGDQDRAIRCYHEVLEITEPRGEVNLRTYALWGLGVSAWRKGSHETAERHVRQGVRIARECGSTFPYFVALSLDLLAWIAAGRREYRRAATLLGAADAILSDIDRPSTAVLGADHDVCERQARAALGDAGFADAFQYFGHLRADRRKPRPAHPDQARLHQANPGRRMESQPTANRQHPIPPAIRA
jgi:predicted ATPase